MKGSTLDMRKKDMRTAQQDQDEFQGIPVKPLDCRAEDRGWIGFIVCQEDNSEGRACGHRLPFGLEALCDNPVRISQMRNGRKVWSSVKGR
jgi:hypothetical protein